MEESSNVYTCEAEKTRYRRASMLSQNDCRSCLHSHSPGAPIRVGESVGGFARVGCSWLGFEGDTCCHLTGAA